MMNVIMMMMMMMMFIMMMICNTCFNHMYFAVLDPLKYIVFCGLRNYDELSSKPVSTVFMKNYSNVHALIYA